MSPNRASKNAQADKAGVDEPKKVTTGIVLTPRELCLYQRVAALRAAQGRTAATKTGTQRVYSVSALLRDLLDEKRPELEAELRAAGLEVP